MNGNAQFGRLCQNAYIVNPPTLPLALPLAVRIPLGAALLALVVLLLAAL